MSKVASASVRPRIAIAGATGRVGSALTELLAADQVEVVALTRQPDKAQASRGIAVAAIDFGAPETVREALRGADRLFISQGSSPQQVANEKALIDAAVAGGVRHIVKVSAMGPATLALPLRVAHGDRSPSGTPDDCLDCPATFGICRRPHQTRGRICRKGVMGGRRGRRTYQLHRCSRHRESCTCRAF